MRDFVLKTAFAVVFITTAVFSAFGAEKTVFQVSCPLTVAVGEPFRVEFQLNASPDDDSFAAPSFEGFEVIAGPAVSKGYSFSSINGSMTKSVSYTLTFVLLPQTAGNITIGTAKIAVDGTTYQTQPQPIEVVDEAAGGAASTQQHQQGGNAQNRREEAQRASEGKIAADDIMLRSLVSRTSVYKGEPLRVTFKLYVRVNVAGFEDVKFPSFNGFWAQELDVQNQPVRRETLNGKVYDTQVIREFLLYPQQTGQLTIDPSSLTAIAQVVSRSGDYDPFFGPRHEVYNVPRKLQSQKTIINVKELPAGAPESFCGAVGRFRMEAQEPQTELAANSAATYTVKIAGEGNLTFVQAPKLNLPSSFELYNVKATESINTSAAGISGYRQFEYPFIARAEGDYPIPAIEFTYFDPQSHQYITLKGKDLSLSITPDQNASQNGQVVVSQPGMSKEEVRMLGQDIRFIKTGKPHLEADREPFLFSATYWGVLGAILAVFLGAWFMLRKRIIESQNVALVRGKRANKVAVQRFRAAKRYMEEQNQHAFYEEMLRALWGYMSDKFNIPVSNLTKENVREELHKRGIAPQESQRFAQIISLCDEAQYSPMASARMADVYADGVDFISRIESVIKR